MIDVTTLIIQQAGLIGKFYCRSPKNTLIIFEGHYHKNDFVHTKSLGMHSCHNLSAHHQGIGFLMKYGRHVVCKYYS